MKDKYIEERFPRWFKFGGFYGNIPDKGDVSDGKGDVFEGISREAADKLEAARHAFVDKLIVIFNEHPELLAASLGKGTR